MSFVDYIKINNFKSIRQLELQDCRRINLLVGKPNVGKSNLLEALSLFSLPYLQYSEKKNLETLIRIENSAELFFDGDIENNSFVETPVIDVEIQDPTDRLVFDYLDKEENNFVISFSQQKSYSLSSRRKLIPKLENPFKTYLYPSGFIKEKIDLPFLLPPHGSNLMSVVSKLPELKEELNCIFKEYGLKYVFDSNSQEIKIMKEKSPGEIFLLPFQSIADSLKRLIFYKAAIESNHNSILIFEEPESHTYPPYITKITDSIKESKDNQFFITTHSPYVLNEFLSIKGNEVAIYLLDYQKGETIVKRMTDADLREMYEYGVDLFFNTETFL